jgi:Protein of unknown function (DUF3631)
MRRAAFRHWHKGKGASAYDLRKFLGDRYGIRPKNIRIGTEQRKGYDLEDFADVWERYGDEAGDQGSREPPERASSDQPDQGPPQTSLRVSASVASVPTSQAGAQTDADGTAGRMQRMPTPASSKGGPPDLEPADDTDDYVARHRRRQAEGAWRGGRPPDPEGGPQ